MKHKSLDFTFSVPSQAQQLEMLDMWEDFQDRITDRNILRDLKQYTLIKGAAMINHQKYSMIGFMIKATDRKGKLRIE